MEIKAAIQASNERLAGSGTTWIDQAQVGLDELEATLKRKRVERYREELLEEQGVGRSFVSRAVARVPALAVAASVAYSFL